MQTSNKEQHHKLFKVCWCASVVCYLLSFIPPVYSTGGTNDSQYLQGAWMFFFGWVMLMVDFLPFLAWTANLIFILLQYYLLARYSNIPDLPISRGMRIGAYLAVVFASMFFFQGDMIVDEAGHYRPIQAYYLGYWLWEASMILLAVTMMARSSSSTIEYRLVDWFLRRINRMSKSMKCIIAFLLDILLLGLAYLSLKP